MEHFHLARQLMSCRVVAVRLSIDETKKTEKYKKIYKEKNLKITHKNQVYNLET